MNAASNFRVDGLIPIVPTPFTVAEEIDLDNLRKLIDFACAAAACAVCLPAYASEFYKLTEEERRLLVIEAVKQAAGRILVAGPGRRSGNHHAHAALTASEPNAGSAPGRSARQSGGEDTGTR